MKTTGLLAIGIGTLLVLGLVGIASPGLRNSREDLAVIRRDADHQLASIRMQVELGNPDDGLVLQRELLKVSRETLHEVREINRKTPDLQPG